MEKFLQLIIKLKHKVVKVGYYITLPKSINSKYVDDYYFPSSRFQTESNETQDNEEAKTDSNEVLNETSKGSETNQTISEENVTNEISSQNETIENVETSESNTGEAQETTTNTTSTNSQTTKKPGDVIYLTEDEAKAKTISTQVAYDFTVESDNTKLYYEQIIKSSKYYENNTNLILEGYMPKDAKIELEEFDQDTINDYENKAIELTENKNNIMYSIYSFKIMNNDEEFNIEKYDKKLDIKIEGIDETKDYTLIKISDDTVSKVESSKTTDGQNSLTGSIESSGIMLC